MNLTELRTATKNFAGEAKQASAVPTADAPTEDDIAEGRMLLESRDHLSSLDKLRYMEEPDWNSWSAIADFFDAYHKGVVNLQNSMAIPLAERRLEGI